MYSGSRAFASPESPQYMHFVTYRGQWIMSYKAPQRKRSTAKGENDGMPEQARDGEIDETYSDGTKRIQFTEDGLETGVRLLSKY